MKYHSTECEVCIYVPTLLKNQKKKILKNTSTAVLICTLELNFKYKHLRTYDNC